MKTKIEIIEDLCNNGAIDFREALILLDKEKEVNELVNKGVATQGYTITNYPNHTSTTYYCTFLPSLMDARVCVTCGKEREFHKIK